MDTGDLVGQLHKNGRASGETGDRLASYSGGWWEGKGGQYSQPRHAMEAGIQLQFVEPPYRKGLDYFLVCSYVSFSVFALSHSSTS